MRLDDKKELIGGVEDQTVGTAPTAQEWAEKKAITVVVPCDGRTFDVSYCRMDSSSSGPPMKRILCERHQAIAAALVEAEARGLGLGLEARDSASDGREQQARAEGERAGLEKAIGICIRLRDTEVKSLDMKAAYDYAHYRMDDAIRALRGKP